MVGLFHQLYVLFIFPARFFFGEGRRGRGLEIPHSFQHLKFCWLHTKTGRRSCHIKWSLDDHWAAFPCVWPAGLPLNILDTGVRIMGVHRNFSRGGQRRHFAYLSRWLTMQCKSAFTKRFALSTSVRKCPMLREQSQNAFIGCSRQEFYGNLS